MELSESLIATLGPNGIRNIAVKLPLSDINHWCRVSSKFNLAICQNDEFWLLKLQDEYPNSAEPDLKLEHAKYAYQLAYAEDHLENEKFGTEAVDKEMSKLRREIEALDDQRKLLFQELEEKNQQKHEVRERNKSELEALQLEALKQLPGPGNLIKIVISDKLDDKLLNLYGDKKNRSLANLQKILGKKMPKVEPHDLVWVNLKGDNTVPDRLIYIYEAQVKGKPLLYSSFADVTRRINIPPVMTSVEGPEEFIIWKYKLPESGKAKPLGPKTNRETES